MNEKKKSQKPVACIEITIEVFMYGYIRWEIIDAGDHTTASWVATSDEGMVCDKGSAELKKRMKPLADKLFSIRLPGIDNEEEDCDSSSGRSWSIGFYDSEDYLIKGIDSDYWDIGILEEIVDIIDGFSKKEAITEWLHKGIEA